MGRRHRVRAATIAITRSGNEYHIAPVLPTPERGQHGDLQAPSPHGSRFRGLSPAEQLAANDELGEGVAVLLEAAAWFGATAATAGLRGRLSASSMIADPGPPDPHRTTAQLRLLRLYNAIGEDAWAVLIQGCVWEASIIPPQRALFRAALHAVATWLKAQKTPLG